MALTDLELTRRPSEDKCYTDETLKTQQQQNKCDKFHSSIKNLTLLKYQTDLNLTGDENNRTLYWHGCGGWTLMIIFTVAIIWAVWSSYILVGEMKLYQKYEKKIEKEFPTQLLKIEEIPVYLQITA